MSKGKCLLIATVLLAVLWGGEPQWALAARPPAGVPNIPGLRTIRTEHYNIRTDLDDALADRMAQLLEGMFGEYSHRLADFQENTQYRTMSVYLFQKKDDYLRLTGPEAKNTGGLFCPAPGDASYLAAYLEGQGRDEMRQTIQHEAFHQFAHDAISHNLPIWLNEGIAQVFQEGLWVGDQFVLGQVPPARLRQLKADIAADRTVDFQKLMSLSAEEWAKNLSDNAARGTTQYNQAWAMVHFLIQANDGMFRPRLINLLKLMHEGKDGDTAWRAAFSPNYAGFQAKFTEWAGDLSATPEAVMIDRQGVLGDMLMSVTNQGLKVNSMQMFQQALTRSDYQLEYTNPITPDLKWKSDPNVRTYFSNTDGQVLNPRQLYFEANPAAPLPDVVCRINERIELRTTFYKLNGRTRHEMKIAAIQN